MLTNEDLIKIAKKMNINLVGVCSKDELNKIHPKIGGYIINLQDVKDGNGTHWVSFILYQDNNTIKSLYFDSYGIPPPIEIKNYIKRLNDNKIPYNNRQIQKIYTSECGWYCLSFLYNIQYKRKSENIIDDYKKWIDKFSNNLNQELIILRDSFKPYNVNFYSKIVALNN
jgi:hypothetical protein